MPSILITGANRGLGLEFARQYLADGWRVFATCRDPAHATDLSGLDGDIEVLALAVDLSRQIDEAAQALKDETLDVLVNNAGIFGPRAAQLGNLDPAAWRHVFEVNAIAPIKIAEAFLANVERADRGRIATVSSKMGSIGLMEGGNEYIYRSSKAALNAAHKALANEVAGRGVTCAVFHPGWVRTDMGGTEADIDAAQSVAGMRAVIERLGPALTGRFWNYDGEELPW
ncbi:MAG: SDR family oxidoreductase [Rhodospirillales bacterium]